MRKSILIVDDEEMNRDLLKQMFEKDYNILLAEDGNQALELLGAHMDDIVIILLDLIMPVVSGYQVLDILKKQGIIDRIPVALITAQSDEQTELYCYTLGASAVIPKPFKENTVMQRVIHLIKTYQSADELAHKVERQRARLREQERKMELFNENLIDVVSNIVEFRNLESGEHVKRVKRLTRIMAETYMELYPDAGLTTAAINVIVRASALHDIGKIAISDRILLKPGPERLTDEEFEIMKTHTTKGCEILKLMDIVQDNEQLQASYDICRHHHERYDGKGYPDHLVGEAIPLSAQLVSVADVYDALVSDRVYKKAFDKETAFQMIIDGKCGAFSPKMMECFKRARTRMEALYSD